MLCRSFELRARIALDLRAAKTACSGERGLCARDCGVTKENEESYDESKIEGRKANKGVGEGRTTFIVTNPLLQNILEKQCSLSKLRTLLLTNSNQRLSN